MTATKIIIHCSDSTWGTITDITEWHRARWGHLTPDGKTPCGYNFVISGPYPTSEDAKQNRKIRLLDGMVAAGRAIDGDEDFEAHEAGAHAYGFNRSTVGVCLIGKDRFTRAQIVASLKVCRLCSKLYRIPIASVVGHRELPGVTKTCPNIDMDWYRKLLTAKNGFEALLSANPQIV